MKRREIIFTFGVWTLETKPFKIKKEKKPVFLLPLKTDCLFTSFSLHFFLSLHFKKPKVKVRERGKKKEILAFSINRDETTTK